MFSERKVKPPTLNDNKDIGEEKDAILIMQGAKDAFDLPSLLTPKSPIEAEKAENRNSGEIDFGAVMEKIGGASSEQTAIGGIMELTHSEEGKDTDEDLAFKSDLFHAGSFTAGQWFAQYNDDLGMPEVGNALRLLCKQQYIHNSALKTRGKLNRAEQAFAALKEEIAKEFQLKKEVKAIMP